MANSQLNTLRMVDPVLTNIARGYANNELIADKLFPIVQVDKEQGKIPVFGKDAFKLWNTERALYAASNQGEGFYPTTVTYTTKEYDFQLPIDYRERKEAADILNLEAFRTTQVVSQLALGKEKICADLAQDLNNYAADNKTTLTDDFWNESAIDPLDELIKYKLILANIIGKEPTTMVLGPIVWRYLVTHPKLKGYFTIGSSGTLTLNMLPNLQKLSELLEIPNIYIGRGIYTTDANAFAKLWENNVILSYTVPPSGIERTPYEPAFGYTLQVKGHPYTDKYTGIGGKVDYIRTSDNYDVQIVGSDGAYIIHNPIDPSVYAAAL